MDETLLLVFIGAGSGAALAFIFGDTANVLRKVLGLGALASPVAGIFFYELATGPDLHGHGAPLEGIIFATIVGSVIFFIAWAVGAVVGVRTRSLSLRRQRI